MGGRARAGPWARVRPRGREWLKRGSRDGEFVVEGTVGEDFEVFDGTELAFEGGNAAVFGGEEHHLRALLLLFGDPSLEFGAAGDEGGHAVAGVEVFALP